MERGSLGRNAVLNSIRQICSILFPFISFAYCSRVLGAKYVGMYTYGQSILSYFLLVSTLGIPDYAIREGSTMRNDKEALQKFINEVFSINFLMTVVAYIMIFLALIFFKGLLDYRVVIMILSVQILMTFMGVDWINSIFEDYFYLAIRTIIIQVMSTIALILLVKSSKDFYIYIVVIMLSNTFGYILNCFYIRRKGIYPKLTIHCKIKKHILPVLVLFCNSVASVIYLNSDVTILGVYTSDSKVGIYTVAAKIYTMMKTLVNAIIMVTVPRFSFFVANRENRKYESNLNKIASILIIFILPIMIGLFLEADKVLYFVAGEEYMSGKNTVKLLSLAIFFAVGACFFSYSILIPNKQEKYYLFSTIIAAIVNITLNCMFIPIYGFDGAAFTTLLAEIIVFLISGYLSFNIVKVRVSLKLILSVLIAGLAVVMVCLIFDMLIYNLIASLFIDIIIAIPVYLCVLFLLVKKGNICF